MIQVVLGHIAFQRTGAWPDKFHLPYELAEQRYEIRTPQPPIDGEAQPDLISYGTRPVLSRWDLGDPIPDLSSFTASDEVAARAAYAEHLRASKPVARRSAENQYLRLCDQIRGDTSHLPLSPADLYTRYQAAIGTGQETAATRLVLKCLLCLVALDQEREAQWNEDAP